MSEKDAFKEALKRNGRGQSGNGILQGLRDRGDNQGRTIDTGKPL